MIYSVREINYFPKHKMAFSFYCFVGDAVQLSRRCSEMISFLTAALYGCYLRATWVTINRTIVYIPTIVI